MRCNVDRADVIFGPIDEFRLLVDVAKKRPCFDFVDEYPPGGATIPTSRINMPVSLVFAWAHQRLLNCDVIPMVADSLLKIRWIERGSSSQRRQVLRRFGDYGFVVCAHYSAMKDMPR